MTATVSPSRRRLFGLRGDGTGRRLEVVPAAVGNVRAAAPGGLRAIVANAGTVVDETPVPWLTLKSVRTSRASMSGRRR